MHNSASKEIRYSSLQHSVEISYAFETGCPFYERIAAGA
jgi:hypothetical protein